jgi:hypothetical protein
MTYLVLHFGKEWKLHYTISKSPPIQKNKKDTRKDERKGKIFWGRARARQGQGVGWREYQGQEAP